MTALQLNADIYRNLGIIAEDESMLDKVAKYLRRVVKQITDDSTCTFLQSSHTSFPSSGNPIKRITACCIYVKMETNKLTQILTNQLTT